MADETATFAVNLEGNLAQVAGNDAQALERLQDALQNDMAALRGMQAAMRNLQGGAVVNIATMKSLRDQITAQKSKIADTTEAVVRLGGDFRKVKPPADESTKGVKALTEALRAGPAPVSAMVGKMTALRAAFAAGPIVAGAVAIVGALALLTGAALGAGIALLKFGIAQADARRNELLHLEALTKLRIGYMGLWAGFGRAAMTGDRLQGIVDRVAAKVPLARDKVGELTEQLYRMGLRGANLQDALEGASIVASTQGDAAASSFMGWAAGANAVGQSVRKLTDDVRARLGPIARAQMLSLDVQTRKLHENVSALFRNVKIEPFLEGLKTLTDLLSQSSASGRALKTIVETLFAGVAPLVAPAALIIKRFFQGMVAGALVATLGILKLRRWWINVFGDSSILKNIDLAKIAFILAAGGVMALGVALGFVVGVAAAAVAPFIIAAIVIDRIAGVCKRAEDALGRLAEKFGVSGRDAAMGFANGLLLGLPSVVASAIGLGEAAAKALKDKLQIHSPSKVTFAAGGFTGAGFAGGIRARIPEVRRAAFELAEAPQRATARAAYEAPIRIAAPQPQRAEAPAAPRADAPRSGNTPRGGAPQVNVTIPKVEVHVEGGGGGDDLEARIAAALELALRNVAANIGAAVSGEAA